MRVTDIESDTKDLGWQRSDLIPTSRCLISLIPKPVSFKKLNKAGRSKAGWQGQGNSHTHPFTFDFYFYFFILIMLKLIYFIKKIKIL